MSGKEFRSTPDNVTQFNVRRVDRGRLAMTACSWHGEDGYEAE